MRKYASVPDASSMDENMKNSAGIPGDGPVRGTSGGGFATLGDIAARAARHPEAPALVEWRPDGTERVTSYGGLWRGVERRAETLASASLEPWSRVGLKVPCGPEFVEWALAIMRAGHCVVPVPADGEEAGTLIREARPRALVDGGGLHVLGQPDGGRDRDDGAFRAVAPAYLRFTSGTTGRRKGVVLGRGTIDQRLDAANEALRVGPEDRVLWLMSMVDHFVVSILLYLRRGAAVLLPGGGGVETAAFALRNRATVSYGAPAHYAELARATPGGTVPLRLAIATSDRLGARTAARFRASWGAPLVQAMGLIEVGLPLVNARRAADKPGSVGRPSASFRLGLLDAGGNLCAAGKPGELHVEGPGMMDAYFDPWTPLERLRGVHGFPTGDIARVDEEGDVFLLGRAGNAVQLPDGRTVYPEEVECILEEYPGVAACRVTVDAKGAPEAEIVWEAGAGGAAREGLASHAFSLLPAWKVPIRFREVAALPRTPTGKIRRWEHNSYQTGSEKGVGAGAKVN